ncbi:MAG: SGNH/GDSL hydrolase family protein [Bacillota bacterium]
MRILTVIVALSCVAAIVFGSMHWKQKIATVSTEEVIATTNIENENDPKTDEKTMETKGISIEEVTSSLPTEAASKLIAAKETDDTVEIVIVGSEANTMGDRIWPDIFKEKMNETYGEMVNITVFDIQNVTTEIVVSDELHMEAVKQNTDIIILEPFMLNDNGAVNIDDTLVNIQTIIEDFKAVNKEAYVFLQPAHPIYNATFYPLEVEQLKTLAENEGHTFIDHWKNWPDYQSEEIKDYILYDSASIAPNEKGHEVWAEYITNLFIATKQE